MPDHPARWDGHTRPCEYADLLTFCTKPAAMLLRLDAEWGGPTHLCHEHAAVMSTHVANAKNQGGKKK